MTAWKLRAERKAKISPPVVGNLTSVAGPSPWVIETTVLVVPKSIPIVVCGTDVMGEPGREEGRVPNAPGAGVKRSGRFATKSSWRRAFDGRALAMHRRRFLAAAAATAAVPAFAPVGARALTPDGTF